MAASALRFSFIAFALVASAVGVAAQEARGAAEAAGAQGTRWSTADLGALFKAEPKDAAADAALRPARLKELRAAVKPRAVAAGAELVWDLGGQSLIGVSPVLWAEPGLALPAAAPVRVLTVDLARLFDRHPDTLAHTVRMRALEKTYQEAYDRIGEAGEVLLGEYKRLTESGKADAAGKKLKEIEAKEAEYQAQAAKWDSVFAAEMRAFTEPMLARLAAGVVETARARGASLLLDVAGPSHLGVSPLVYVDPALRPAPEGGVREAGAAVAVIVRTVDLARLHAEHPATRAQQAEAGALEKKAKAETARTEKDVARLIEEYTRLTERGDSTGAEKVLDQITEKSSEHEKLKKATSQLEEERLAAQRKATLAEVAKLAGEVAHRAGATLLLDTGGHSHLGVSYLLYAAPTLDLTEAVAKELKGGRGR